jgi:starch synthase
LRILSVASECYPLVKTGGLADVVGALPGALAPLGCEVKVLLPGYPVVMDRVARLTMAAYFPDLFGGSGRVLSGRLDEGTDVLVLDAPHLYERPGGIYNGPDGRDWPDNALRFAALSAVAAAIGRRGIAGWVPDIVHAHDWQAGLVPVYLADGEGPRPKTVFTIHNIAFQGLIDGMDYWKLGLPWHHYHVDGLEFYGDASALKGGIVYSDWITTVSPTYARELRTPGFGGGLDGVLNQRAGRLSGILNGVDTGEWNPETDSSIAAPFSAADVSGKAASKRAVQGAFGLSADPDRMLLSVISRLTEQKGLDLVIAEAGRILQRGGQLAVLGSGDPALELAFAALKRQAPDRVGVSIGYDEPLSHLLQAGADAILVPSRFEPCGLTQLYALRYGTIPIVARTGGLADTVIDANDAALKARTGTGFQFAPVTAEALGFALERAFDLYEDRAAWAKLRQRAMRHPVGWETSAKQYVALYKSLLQA